ncbi:MAG: rod shape-determining protein MreC [Pseudomonadota bacterium]
MRPERYSYGYASRGSAKSLKSRVLVAVLLLIGVSLLVMTRLHSPLIVRARMAAGDMLSPVLEAVTVPVSGIRNLMANKDALFKAYEENKQMREENDTLRHWQAVAQALKVENESLRALAAYRPVEQVSYVTAHVIAQSPDAYAGTLMINAGAADGLKSLQPVIDAHGLVGRVVEVGEHTARVLLLSDTSSRVPVISGNSRQHAILAGAGEALLHLTFVGGDVNAIALGEPVMTTAEGGLIPDSIMVGTVFRRDATGLLVKPLRPLAQSEYVRVMIAK